MSEEDHSQEIDEVIRSLRERAKLIHDQCEASQQKGGAIPKGKFRMILARSKKPGYYYHLDEKMLAMGIFIETQKKEFLKNDPDFAFTMKFYHDARCDFDSLHDDVKFEYIDEAMKRNTVEDKAANYRDIRNKRYVEIDDNHELENKAGAIYYDALYAEVRKFGKKSPHIQTYTEAFENDEVIEPYLAEALVRQVDEVAELMKTLNR